MYNKYYKSLLNRIKYLESLVYESKEDEEKLRNYLGDELFDSYMNIRTKIPSISDLNRAYPEFIFKELEDSIIRKSFIKKYNNIRKHRLINNNSKFMSLPSIITIDDSTSDYFNDYHRMRKYVLDTYNNFRSFENLKSLPKDKIKDFVSKFTTIRNTKLSNKINGAELIYEDNLWKVYRITTYEAAQYYGKNTKWCITGTYNRGEDYFNDYINTEGLDGGYYFYINKQDPSKKYCLLQTKDGTVKSIWDPMDTNRGSSINAIKAYGIELPEVPGINLHNDSLSDYITSTTTNDIYPELKTFLMNNKLTKGELNEALFTICSNSTDCDKVVKLLLKYGADPSYNDAIFFAARKSDLYNTVKAILDNGFNVNTISKSRKRDTLLHRAAYSNAINIVKLLLDYGADSNIKDAYGDTPLDSIKNSPLCSYSDYKNVIELLEANT